MLPVGEQWRIGGWTTVPSSLWYLMLNRVELSTSIWTVGFSIGRHLAIDCGKVDLCHPVVDAVGEDLDEHRAVGFLHDLLDPCLVLVIEVLRAPERGDEFCLEVPAGLPAHGELLLKAFQGLGHIGAERVHVGHRECTEAL